MILPGFSLWQLWPSRWTDALRGVGEGLATAWHTWLEATPDGVAAGWEAGLAAVFGVVGLLQLFGGRRLGGHATLLAPWVAGATIALTLAPPESGPLRWAWALVGGVLGSLPSALHVRLGLVVVGAWWGWWAAHTVGPALGVPAPVAVAIGALAVAPWLFEPFLSWSTAWVGALCLAFASDLGGDPWLVGALAAVGGTSQHVLARRRGSPPG